MRRVARSGAGDQALALHDGVEMPQLGFGVFQIPAEETQERIEEALAVGYRRPPVNQIELHPRLQQAELRAWHATFSVA